MKMNYAFATLSALGAAALLTMAIPAAAENAKSDAPSGDTPAAKSSVCLRYNDVDGWGARDRKSMVVDDRFGRKYLVSLSGLCDDLNYALGAGFRPLGGAYAGGCVDRGDHVVMRGGGLSGMDKNICWVTKVQPYTKEMQAADKLAKDNKQPLATY